MVMPAMNDTVHRDTVLVLGATGFVGRPLVRALQRKGVPVRAASRKLDGPAMQGVEHVMCDVTARDDVERAVKGARVIYYLVHSMGHGAHDYEEKELSGANNVVFAAAQSHAERIIYLGGVAPRGKASRHLRSRLRVGEVLRAGSVPTIELRASMIIGRESASWQIVRDLAMRLPAMLLPSWTESRTCPIALDDVIFALVRAMDLPLSKSECFDLPGPQVMSGKEILMRIAALRGRRMPSVSVPLLTVSLSSWWLKFITRADFDLARELVLGLTGDLLPRDDRFWELLGRPRLCSFDEAASRAFAQERLELSLRGVAGKLEETVVQLVSPKLPNTP
jgi:uncharacterized protein YbjT (DUF2867 family)